MQRVKQRQGFLVSAVIHLTLLMMLLAQPPSQNRPGEVDASEWGARDTVFLPPPEVLRQLTPSPPVPPQARSTPAPTPPPQSSDATKKDRISIGPPSDRRTEGPLILRREDDLTQVPKGRPDVDPRAVPTPVAPTPAPTPPVARRGGGTPETPGRQGLRLPPGLFGPPEPLGDEGSPRPGAIGSSVDDAVDDLSRRMAREGRLGLPTGTGQNVHGLRFDPQGADFTLWVNDFKNQVYRNWIVPLAGQMGYGGHVDFEFVVERDGSMSSLRMLKSSGTVSLDRAARNSLTSSRFQPLPDDYGPPRVTMQVTFVYGPPRAS